MHSKLILTGVLCLLAACTPGPVTGNKPDSNSSASPKPAESNTPGSSTSPATITNPVKTADLTKQVFLDFLNCIKPKASAEDEPTITSVIAAVNLVAGPGIPGSFTAHHRTWSHAYGTGCPGATDEPLTASQTKASYVAYLTCVKEKVGDSQKSYIETKITSVQSLPDSAWPFAKGSYMTNLPEQWDTLGCGTLRDK